MKLFGLSVWQWDLISLALVVAGFICLAWAFYKTRNNGNKYNLYHDLREWLEARKAKKGGITNG